MVGVARAAVNGSLKGFQAAGRLGAAWVSESAGFPHLLSFQHFCSCRWSNRNQPLPASLSEAVTVSPGIQVSSGMPMPVVSATIRSDLFHMLSTFKNS